MTTQMHYNNMNAFIKDPTVQLEYLDLLSKIKPRSLPINMANRPKLLQFQHHHQMVNGYMNKTQQNSRGNIEYFISKLYI